MYINFVIGSINSTPRITVNIVCIDIGIINHVICVIIFYDIDKATAQGIGVIFIIINVINIIIYLRHFLYQC